ncbi:fumarate reductase/succinate dehydrogenase flavoprotein subunit [Candidatus Palauibacter sp.]|uniref:fumarate reductase/succinate dehydrogenase flavoprotein subunit n=1 Tax=Candidatus Palauibacter sp. TaxID=3101350 RepID=UPI003B596315
MDIPERHEHDVLVIGAGGAGLRAAIAAIEAGASVGLVGKSLLGKAHTVMAEGGMAAALGNNRPEDDWRVHFRDTMRGGKGLCDWRMAQAHAREAPDRVRELEAWGALFDRAEDGRMNQRPFGGHTYARLAHVGDRTGLELIRTLQDHAVHEGADVFMECTVFRLVMVDGRVAGALAYWRPTGEFVLFRARTVILATGGLGKAWKVTSNSWECTGDGVALAYEAGAELMGMEFVQFHPTGMVWPPSVRGTLVTEGVRGEGGVLTNSEGERFMFRYVPEMFEGDYAESEAEADRWVEGDRVANRRPPELLTRDVVAKAIVAEVEAGRGSPHGGVFLDISSKRSPEYIKAKLPSMYHQFRELAAVDITTDAMEVGPTTHYAMGGVKVDPETATTCVPRLYAAGEVAAGLHGGNRLGGNSLSDLIVFGRRAGADAAAAARDLELADIDEGELEAATSAALAPFGRTDGRNPFHLQEELQQIMQDKVGIARTEAALREALAEVQRLRGALDTCSIAGGRAFNPGWHTWLDLHAMLTVSEAVVRSAIERRESRGAHTRIDYPDSDPGLGRSNLVLRCSEGRMTTATQPVSEPPDELRQLIEEGV